MMCLLPLPVEVDDLKKVSNSLSVLLTEKQKQEKVSALFSRKWILICWQCQKTVLCTQTMQQMYKSTQIFWMDVILYLASFLNDSYLISQQNKGKKKKKGVVPGGGFKAQMKDDFDYAELDGGYTQDYDDFMWQWLLHSCPLPISPLRNAAVPSHAVQCHPGKSELFVAPFIFASVTRGTLPGSIRFHHLLCSYIWNCLFFCLV